MSTNADNPKNVPTQTPMTVDIGMGGLVDADEAVDGKAALGDGELLIVWARAGAGAGAVGLPPFIVESNMNPLAVAACVLTVTAPPVTPAIPEGTPKGSLGVG